MKHEKGALAVWGLFVSCLLFHQQNVLVKPSTLSGSEYFLVGRVKKLKSKLCMVHHTVPLGSGQRGAPITRVSLLSVSFPFYQSHPCYILRIKPSWQMRAEDYCVVPQGCPLHTWNCPSHHSANLSYCILQPFSLWKAFFTASFSAVHVLAFKY